MDFNISDFGAKSDGTLSTSFIQKAIDECFLQGGGTVIIPKGDFLTGSIRLRSGVQLYLKSGAHLIGSKNAEDYGVFINDKLEPIPDDYKTNDIFLPFNQRKSYDFMNKRASRWNNALIKAIDAENIAVTGEEDSYIDGMDCYDSKGEEGFRGPHAINFFGCKNIKLSGYKIKNSANWAHALFLCANIYINDVTVEAGHDGVHLTSCSNIKISKCNFYTGDDCIAGIDNLNMSVTNCEINTACNGFRLGGENISIENCHIFGPGRFCHRLTLSEEEKQIGKIENDNHRFNMMSAFTYYADFSRPFKTSPGDILMNNCRIENVERFFNYNFSNDKWQTNVPMKSITFSNITATGIKLPLYVFGSSNLPITFKLQNSNISFAYDRSVKLWWDKNKTYETYEFIKAGNFEKILLDSVTISGIQGHAIIKSWSNDGTIICKNSHFGIFDKVLRKNTNEKLINV